MENENIVAALLEYLKEKKIVNKLEQDILSTINIYMKTPFNRKKGEQKICENNIKYIDICFFVQSIPGRTNKSFNQADDVDVRSNLYFQIEAIAIKDGLDYLIQAWRNM